MHALFSSVQAIHWLEPLSECGLKYLVVVVWVKGEIVLPLILTYWGHHLCSSYIYIYIHKYINKQIYIYLYIYIYTFIYFYLTVQGFPDGSDGQESACNAGDPSSIPESGRSPGEGNGNPLQYSCLENSMDRGAWQATVHGVAKSQTRLSDQQTDTRLNTRSYLQHAGSLVAAYAIWASLVAQLVKNPPAMRETWVQSLGWEDPLEKGKATHSSILAWRIPWTI